MQENIEQIDVGTLIRDGSKIGIIYREIKSGTWTDQPLFNWQTNFEIYYDDGTVCVMGKETLLRLVSGGKVEILDSKQ